MRHCSRRSYDITVVSVLKLVLISKSEDGTEQPPMNVKAPSHKTGGSHLSPASMRYRWAAVLRNRQLIPRSLPFHLKLSRRPLDRHREVASHRDRHQEVHNTGGPRHRQGLQAPLIDLAVVGQLARGTPSDPATGKETDLPCPDPHRLHQAPAMAAPAQAPPPIKQDHLHPT
jgi:hypothetical protein